MRSLRNRLPPLNSLVAFEASARHLSFTRAGQELSISREAVSRQIRILESHLGVKLFERLYRSLALTEEGEAFHRAVDDLGARKVVPESAAALIARERDDLGRA